MLKPTLRALCASHARHDRRYDPAVLVSSRFPRRSPDLGRRVIVSHCRQENRSRTVWITFHCRGMTSSVSVTSSPSFDSLAAPQHGQLSGTAITTHSRGRCAESDFRLGRFRSKDLTIVERAQETVGPPRPRRFEAEGRLTDRQVSKILPSARQHNTKCLNRTPDPILAKMGRRS